MVKLVVCISTINERVNNLHYVLLKPVSFIRYVVIHQVTNSNLGYQLELLNRSDITYQKIIGKGITQSRNLALSMVKNDEVIVLSDDDVKYKLDYFLKVRDIYNTYTDVDVCTFKVKTIGSDLKFKEYDENTKIIDTPILLKPIPSSIEITFRSRVSHEMQIKFDERFGAGNFFVGGEEKLFMSECIKRRLKIMFVPEYIVEHKFESTSTKYPRYGKEKSRYIGAHNYMTKGLEGLARTIFSPLKNYKIIVHNSGKPLDCIWYGIQGYLYMAITDILKGKRTRISS